MSTLARTSRTTIRTLQGLKQSQNKIAMLTAYDAITARLVEEAGVDLILVGDSLGNVVLGYENTIPVTLDDMIRHTAAVVRGTEKALIVLDLPFGTTSDPETALRGAIRAFQETGCQAVKLEGGTTQAAVVQRLTQQGIPVMGHIGLTPQFIHQLGGYYRHGKTTPELNRLKDAAFAIQDAGAFALVLECVIPEVAAEITESLNIPTIGIGSGPACDGQVLVINDLIGLSIQAPPSFAKARANVASIISEAVRSYVGETKGSAAKSPVERSVTPSSPVSSTPAPSTSSRPPELTS